MDQTKKFKKDAAVRKMFAKKEIDILLFKYGVLTSKKKDYKNYYFFKFIKRFHLNWSSSRAVNKCLLSGRTSWPIRRFRLSRMMFKNLFDENEGMTGVRRSSW